MKNIFDVRLSKSAETDLTKVPIHIIKKLRIWIANVGEFGLIEVSKIRGFHDEPLYGSRKGQRSIRLNKSYRAIYRILEDNNVEFIEIKEVNKHDY